MKFKSIRIFLLRHGFLFGIYWIPDYYKNEMEWLKIVVCIFLFEIRIFYVNKKWII